MNSAAINTMNLVESASQDYQNLKTELPELNMYKDKNMVPQYINVNGLPNTYNKENIKPYKYNFDKIKNDLSFHNLGHSTHAEKKW